MRHKLIVFVIGLVVYFGPALVFQHVYHNAGATVMWLLFGIMPAILVMAYFDDSL